MKRIFSILLTLMMVLAAVMPQSVLADTQNAQEKDYAFDTFVTFWGGAQPVSDSSIEVSWLSLMGCESYEISWRPAGSTEKPSTALAGSDADSYVITGLEPGKKYEIGLRGVLTDSDGKVYTLKSITYGYTEVRKPVYVTRESTGSYIKTEWKVQEKDAVLNVYRATKKNGEYQLIGTTDGLADEEQKQNKLAEGKVTFTDKNVKAKKSYYYKASVKLEVDGRQVESEQSKIVTLAAKNSMEPVMTAKLVNKRGTYTKRLTWKLTSNSANYNILFKKIYKVNSERSNGNTFYTGVTSTQYSYNGKKYYKLRPGKFTLKPGKTVYFRVNLKSRFWVRRDGIGGIPVDIKYQSPSAKNITVNIGINNKIKTNYTDDSQGDGMSYFEWFFKEGPCTEPCVRESKSTVKDSSSVELTWMSCEKADSFAVRYGKTQAEAEAAVPVKLPFYQIGYTLNGLEPDQDYYIIVSALSKDQVEHPMRAVVKAHTAKAS